VIVRTFGNILLNDHTRADILHHPFLVAIKEIIPDRTRMFNQIDKCWAQLSWSPSINPNGAYFCEMAASFSMLFSGSMKGWPVKKEWWLATVKDYAAQIEHFCPRCGGAANLKRRPSISKVDDISPGNLELLKPFSARVQKGLYQIHNLRQVAECDMGQMQSYKDQQYRDIIAARYGIFLVINKEGFNDPRLMREGRKLELQPTILDRYKERYEIPWHG
jgi:hypothetical protein